MNNYIFNHEGVLKHVEAVLPVKFECMCQEIDGAIDFEDTHYRCEKRERDYESSLESIRAKGVKIANPEEYQSLIQTADGRDIGFLKVECEVREQRQVKIKGEWKDANERTYPLEYRTVVYLSPKKERTDKERQEAFKEFDSIDWSKGNRIENAKEPSNAEEYEAYCLEKTIKVNSIQEIESNKKQETLKEKHERGKALMEKYQDENFSIVEVKGEQTQFPKATEEQRKGGWTHSVSFMIDIEEFVNKKGESVSLEAIDLILQFIKMPIGEQTKGESQEDLWNEMRACKTQAEVAEKFHVTRKS